MSISKYTCRCLHLFFARPVSIYFTWHMCLYINIYTHKSDIYTEFVNERNKTKFNAHLRINYRWQMHAKNHGSLLIFLFHFCSKLRPLTIWTLNWPHQLCMSSVFGLAEAEFPGYSVQFSSFPPSNRLTRCLNLSLSLSHIYIYIYISVNSYLSQSIHNYL